MTPTATLAPRTDAAEAHARQSTDTCDHGRLLWQSCRECGVSAYTPPASVRLEVWGPNLRTTTEQIHVHAAGCADTKRGIYRGAEKPYTSEFASQRDVVEFVYPPEDFDYDSDAEWESFAGDVRFFPCCENLPRDRAVLAAEA